MKRTPAILSLLVLALALLPAPAAGEPPEGSSELNAWSLSGQLLAEGGERLVETRAAYPCSEIHELIRAYNRVFLSEDVEPPPGWPRFIGTLSVSAEDYAVLEEYYAGDEDLGTSFTYDYPTVVVFCTSVHEDGWKVATAEALSYVDSDSPWVSITAYGPMSCDEEPGQLLMIQSGYFFFDGAWQSYFGTDWVEEFGGGLPTWTGNYTMRCVSVVPGGDDDFASIAELVPTAQINLNPTLQGLTGLETWLWYDFTSPESHQLSQSISVDARGTTWVLDMSAWVDEVHWDVDCEGSCEFRGTRVAFDTSGTDYVLDLADSELAAAPVYDGGAGLEGQAASEHLYRTKGDYVVSTATMWRGVYTFQGITYLYEPVVVADAAPYQVIEVRSQLVTPDS